MTQTIRQLEREIEESRARLDLTIDRLQDRLSMSGIVDELLGQMRISQYSSLFDDALTIIRRNPLPVILVAAGVGWLVHRMTQDARRAAVGGRVAPSPRDIGVAVGVDPAMPTVSARVYEDVSSLPASQDTLEERRKTGAM